MRPLSRPLVPLALLVMTAGHCAATTRAPSGANAAIAAQPSAPQRPGLVPLSLEHGMPAVVGATVRATASGLTPGAEGEFSWGTVSGGWAIEDASRVLGKRYSDTTFRLGPFTVDARGRLDATFTVPEDYGGLHEVTALVDRRPVAHGSITVTPTFALSPTSGPVGTPLELKVTGLGWRPMDSTWVVSWDNGELGLVTAAGTRGSAVARFRAAGPIGDHLVTLRAGWQGHASLNDEPSPIAPRPRFTFRTTPGTAGDAVYAEAYRPQYTPPADRRVTGTLVSLEPSQGPVGTRVLLRGEPLEPLQPLQVTWETVAGRRANGDGFATQEHVLAEIRTDPDGRFQLPLTIPRDLGGLHGLALRAGDELIARAYFTIETSIVDMTPRSGPAGTPVTIHLEGVGWTDYDNLYVATYDNAYMGYACSCEGQGDVAFTFTAAGEPGPHLLDLYPGIDQGPATELQQLYRRPQLTYADDHPGRIIPALRFVFDVTP